MSTAKLASWQEKRWQPTRYADACVHGDILSSLQFRLADNDTTGQLVLSSYHPTEIELQRSGDTFTFSAAVFGETYKSVSKELSLAEELYAGLFICSHEEDVMEQAIFSNVQVIIPAAKISGLTVTISVVILR